MIVKAIKNIAGELRHWAALALLDPYHVVELALEERAIRALAIVHGVDERGLVRAYRHRVRSEAWGVRRELEEALARGEDPTEEQG